MLLSQIRRLSPFLLLSPIIPPLSIEIFSFFSKSNSSSNKMPSLHKAVLGITCQHELLLSL